MSHGEDEQADRPDDATAPGAGHDPDRVETRAELLPEEQEAGSDDPEAQAAAILADSDERTEAPVETRHDATSTPD